MSIIFQFGTANIYVHKNGIFMVYIYLTFLLNHVNVFVDNVNSFGVTLGKHG
jgi:hypothetical protein